jgi:DNA-binding LytR/AlgR family response regulator
MGLPLNCIIVEDEPLAAEILAEYISTTPSLHLVQTCPDAVKALDVLNNNTIDLIFLDINLPKLSGIDFLKTLPRKPGIIITTAYHEYAIEGFELQVVDYLLKPIEQNRFLKAVDKAIWRAAAAQEKGHIPPPPERPFYVSKRSVKIYLDEIVYIESLKDSVAIHLTNGAIHHTHYQLGQLEQVMPSAQFIRVHRSFLVAVDKVTSHSSTAIEIAKITLPIGRSHKQEVLECLEQRY